jgi:hypothetical protein
VSEGGSGFVIEVGPVVLPRLVLSFISARRVVQQAGSPLGDVGPEGAVGDGHAVVVGEVLPDFGDAGAGACLDHRVDAGMEAVQGCRVALELLPRRPARRRRAP